MCVCVCYNSAVYMMHVTPGWAYCKCTLPHCPTPFVSARSSPYCKSGNFCDYKISKSVVSHAGLLGTLLTSRLAYSVRLPEHKLYPRLRASTLVSGCHVQFASYIGTQWIFSECSTGSVRAWYWCGADVVLYRYIRCSTLAFYCSLLYVCIQ